MGARISQHPEEKGAAIRGCDSREYSKLPFLENSSDRMPNFPTGIIEFYI